MMETKDTFKVPKKEMEVTLVLTENQKLQCSVFLAHMSSTMGGIETLDEFLNQDDRQFIPVHVKETDRNILVSKKLIVYLHAAEADETGEKPDGPRPTTTADVEVDISNGECFEGTVRIFKELRHSRVQDFLNDPRKYLPLYPDRGVIFINRDMIRCVRERTA